MVVLRSGLSHYLDASANAIAIRFHSVQSNVEPVSEVGAAVHPQLCGLIEAGCNNVDAAITVEVAEGAAAMTCRGGLSESGFSGERLPFSARTEIAEDNVGFSELVAGRPDRGDLSARDEEVLPAVVVEIIKGRPEAGHAHAECAHAAGRGGLSKVAFASVEVDGKRLALECDVDNVWDSHRC